MKNDQEIVGTLLGFDDFVNMVLEDVTEYESTPEGRRITKLDQILLNGNNITMVNNHSHIHTYNARDYLLEPFSTISIHLRLNRRRTFKFPKLPIFKLYRLDLEVTTR